MKLNKETEAKICADLVGGRTLMIGLYMGYKAKPLEYVNKKGLKVKVNVITHTIIQGSGGSCTAIQAEEMLDEGKESQVVKAAFVTGTPVLVHVGTQKEDLGHVSCRVGAGGITALQP